MRKLLFGVFALFAVVVNVDAQTVTNADLEKYRFERLKAEAELRENYTQLGFPSPEERARRDAESVKAAAELSAKLRAERLERERIEAARAQQPAQIEIVKGNAGQDLYWYTGYWRVPRWPRRQYVQPGYFAGGSFWPTGNRTRPRPLFVQVRK